MFFAAFVAIIIIMFIANQSKEVEMALDMPFNEGIRALSAYENYLMAVTSDGKTYLWDWEQLDQKAKTGNVASEKALLLDSDSVVSIKQGRPTTLYLSNFHGDVISKKILLESDKSRGFLVANRGCSTLAAIIAKTSDSEDRTNYRILNIDLERNKASMVADIIDNSFLIQLTDYAISDNGKYIVVAGEQGDKARLVLVDIEKSRVLWDKIYDDPDGYGSAIFSPDGKTIFAGGSDGIVYYIQISDGKIIDQFHFKAKGSTAHKTISIQNLTMSPDETMLAYTFGFYIYIFDYTNKTEIHSQYPNQKLPGPLVFSPDSKEIATSDFRQGGKIRIWSIQSE